MPASVRPARKQVLFAAILNDMFRAAGRSGVGAVMGSKNLKAVAVVGSKPIQVADPKGFETAVLKGRKLLKEHPVGGAGLKAYGTDVLINIMNETGALPTRNFRDSQFATADKVGGESLSANILVRPKGCFSCVISCGRVTRVTNPKYANEGEGPEYEASWAMGPDCGIDNLDAITKSNRSATNSAWIPFRWALPSPAPWTCMKPESSRRKDTDGMNLSFGNPDALVELTRKIGLREGIGDRLALGSYRFAASLGHPEFSMTVKKQEMPAYDPRGVQGIGLEYATCNRGGCHVKGYTIAVEVLGCGAKLDPHETKDKPQWTKLFQDLTAAIDASGGCIFGTFGMGGDNYAEMLTALTGITYSTEEYIQAGERIWNLERLFNLRAGLTAADDTLPERLLKSPIKAGPAKGEVSHVPEMLPEYYKLRGWNEKGVPTKDCLQKLQLA